MGRMSPSPSFNLRLAFRRKSTLVRRDSGVGMATKRKAANLRHLLLALLVGVGAAARCGDLRHGGSGSVSVAASGASRGLEYDAAAAAAECTGLRCFDGINAAFDVSACCLEQSQSAVTVKLRADDSRRRLAGGGVTRVVRPSHGFVPLHILNQP